MYYLKIIVSKKSYFSYFLCNKVINNLDNSGTLITEPLSPIPITALNL